MKIDQRGNIQLEAASIALIALIVKVGNFRPKHLQQLGYPKRTVMRTLKRLRNAGVIEKKRDGGYAISSHIQSGVREISFGIEELDGFAEFLLTICYGEHYTASQVEECARRLNERGKTLVRSREVSDETKISREYARVSLKDTHQSR